MASPTTTRPSFKTSDFRLVIDGLNCPEGPFYRPCDNTVLVGEIGARIPNCTYALIASQPLMPRTFS